MVAGDVGDIEEAEDTGKEHRMGNTGMDIAYTARMASFSKDEQ